MVSPEPGTGPGGGVDLRIVRPMHCVWSPGWSRDGQQARSYRAAKVCRACIAMPCRRSYCRALASGNSSRRPGKGCGRRGMPGV